MSPHILCHINMCELLVKRLRDKCVAEMCKTLRHSQSDYGRGGGGGGTVRSAGMCAINVPLIKNPAKLDTSMSALCVKHIPLNMVCDLLISSGGSCGITYLLYPSCDLFFFFLCVTRFGISTPSSVRIPNPSNEVVNRLKYLT